LHGAVVERWSLTGELSLYRSANQADSAFHPFGVDK